VIVPAGVATLTEWRGRLRQAQQAYMQASDAAAKIHAKYEPQTADEESALQQALRAERQARDEYMTVLRIFTRVLDGEMSPE